MTLICGTIHEGIPLLIGDVLLSSRYESTHAPVATFERTESIEFFDRTRHITGFHSKLIILRRNLAIAWAGNRMNAENVFQFLDNALPENPCVADLQSRLTDFSARNPAHVVELIVALVDARPEVIRWNGQTGAIEMGSFFASGSGAAIFEDRIESLLSSNVGSAEGNQAVAWALEKVGLFVGSEMKRGENLPHFFGGGFEVISYDKSGFFRVDKIATVLCDVSISRVSPLKFIYTFPNKMLLQRIDQGLCIESLELIPESTRAAQDVSKCRAFTCLHRALLSFRSHASSAEDRVRISSIFLQRFLSRNNICSRMHGI